MAEKRGVEDVIGRVADAALVIYEAARKLRFEAVAPETIADVIDAEIGELILLSKEIRGGV